MLTVSDSATLGTAICTAGLIWATFLLFQEGRATRRFQERVHAQSLAPDILVYMWMDAESDSDKVLYKLTVENPTDNSAYNFSVAPKTQGDDVYFYTGEDKDLGHNWKTSSIRPRYIVPPHFRYDYVFWNHKKESDGVRPFSGVACWIVVTFNDANGKPYTKDVLLDDVMLNGEWIVTTTTRSTIRLA